MAKVFSSHGAKTTILSTTPATARVSEAPSATTKASTAQSPFVSSTSQTTSSRLTLQCPQLPPWTPRSSENLQAFTHPKPTRLHCHPRLPSLGCECHQQANE
ncbi:hypothetical protein Pyn_36499 [Prunus yedoensis var. nudiflora]|uniref:Uncharacterized protein n=1 Tax=Prunus yedoensis var. nudiflora TaxID=2094558 RepID=A0A314YKZ0_PRUYE|nr:hypothetical protein Pyn_36499 [Prunus yedoensis var. nudiflora]